MAIKKELKLKDISQRGSDLWAQLRVQSGDGLQPGEIPGRSGYYCSLGATAGFLAGFG